MPTIPIRAGEGPIIAPIRRHKGTGVYQLHMNGNRYPIENLVQDYNEKNQRQPLILPRGKQTNGHFIRDYSGVLRLDRLGV